MFNGKHVRSLVREARYGHSHACGTHKSSEEYEQCLRLSGHLARDFLGDGHKQDAGDGLTNERGDHLRIVNSWT